MGRLRFPIVTTGPADNVLPAEPAEHFPQPVPQPVSRLRVTALQASLIR